jgi:hypothetical protein
MVALAPVVSVHWHARCSRRQARFTATSLGEVVIQMRIARTVSIATTVLALAATPALAQEPTDRGYDETLGVIGQVDTPSTPQSESAPSQGTTAPAEEATPTPAQPVKEESGSLPFTGLDIGIVALMGLVLLGVGVALRRTTTARRDAI